MVESNLFPEGFALLIGVGRYESPDLSIPMTAADAEDLRGILTSPQHCGYPADQVVTLANEEATKATILAELDALSAKVRSTTSQNATVIVFFSGHGWREEGYHLLSHDSKVAVIGGAWSVDLDTAISNGEFIEKVRAIPAKRLVVLFNTCFSGGAGTPLAPQFPRAPQMTPVPLGLFDDLLEGSGSVIISSSKQNERSWIRSDAKNSVFAEHLLAGLQGQGVSAVDETIRIFDLFGYLSMAVPQDAQSIGKKQTPVFKAYDLTRNFAVALRLGGAALSPGSARGATQFWPVAVQDKVDELARLLLKTQAMSHRARRDVVVSRLPSDVQHTIRRSDINRDDVTSIVKRCIDFGDGLEQLVRSVRMSEGPSKAMAAVENWLSGNQKLKGPAAAMLPRIETISSELPHSATANSSPQVRPVQPASDGRKPPSCLWASLLLFTLALAVVVMAIRIGYKMVLPGPEDHVFVLKVKSQDTGEGILGARVTLDVASMPSLTTRTDNNGDAAISVPTSYLLRSGSLSIEAPEFEPFLKNLDRIESMPATIWLDAAQLSFTPTRTHAPTSASRLK